MTRARRTLASAAGGAPATAIASTTAPNTGGASSTVTVALAATAAIPAADPVVQHAAAGLQDAAAEHHLDVGAGQPQPPDQRGRP